MLIEIRSARGERLVSAPDLSAVIAQLVSLCGNYRQIIEEYHAKFAGAALIPPDISATAPEHVEVFSAGWKAGRDAAVAHVS